MTFREIDEALAAACLRYDPETEFFYDGERPVLPDEVMAALPDATPDELASFMDANYDLYVSQG